MGIPQLAARRLRRKDASGLRLAAEAGVHGVYVSNALLAGQHDGLVLSIDGVDCGLAWFGRRGNLVLIANEHSDGRHLEFANHVRSSRWSWRIVLGPAAIVEELAAQQTRSPLAHRTQIYYEGGREHADPQVVRDDVRLPVPADRERLARATLALNASDLNIAPSRVDRRWLYNMIDERIREHTTRVLGPVGELSSKLDFGSAGAAGTVLEGVFTFPDTRGRGLGAGLVATCMAQAEGLLTLHVAEHNRSARSAYERAGMREAGSCRLLLIT